MKKYIIHIFDVDKKGSIKADTIKVHEIFCNSDKQALEQGETMRKERSLKEPLGVSEIWGQMEYLCNVWNTDELGQEYEII